MKTSGKSTSPAIGCNLKASVGFPTTQWNLLDAIRTSPTGRRNDILNGLMRSYWRPLYAYVLNKGYGEDEAQDAVQSFLLACIEKDLFSLADQRRGRFRTFLRTSCDNFLKNLRRAEQAKRRRPPRGIISIETLLAREDDRHVFEPRQNETPEDVFNRIWACDLILKVLGALKEECRQTGKQMHQEIFEVRIVKPALEGTSPPPLRDLSGRFNMQEKQVANALLTARRAFQRLLRQEVRTYSACDDDVTLEIRDLFEFLSPRDP